MARLATEADFHGERTGNPDAMYSEYRRYRFFAQRAAVVVQRYPTANRILVVGCGPGFLVDELIKAGKPQTWGIDAAPYATALAVAELGGTVGARVRLADATSAAAVRAAKLAFGLGQNQRFDLAVTEDVLPCLTPAGQTALLSAVRAHASALFHVITPGDPADPAKLPGLDWRPIADWRTVIGPGEPILDAETWEISV